MAKRPGKATAFYQEYTAKTLYENPNDVSNVTDKKAWEWRKEKSRPLQQNPRLTAIWLNAFTGQTSLGLPTSPGNRLDNDTRRKGHLLSQEAQALRKAR